jgi:ketosteroid isomerase-like protein
MKVKLFAIICVLFVLHLANGATVALAAPQAEQVTEIVHIIEPFKFCVTCENSNPELFRLARRLLSERGSIEVNQRDRAFTITDQKETVDAIRLLVRSYHEQDSFTEPTEFPTPGSAEAETQAAIRAVIDGQAAAWNRGDVEGYMDGYDRSPNTEFVGGDSITRGWQQVLDRYKQRYDTREKMGVLTFSDLEINVLSKDAALVLGRWRLKRTNDEPHGTFTLLFRKTKAGWRIVHDHSSSA